MRRAGGETEDAPAERALRSAARKADKSGVRQFVLEDRDHQLAMFLRNRIDDAIGEYPLGLVQQQSRQREARLFIAVEFPPPARGAIERFGEGAEAHPSEYCGGIGIGTR